MSGLRRRHMLASLPGLLMLGAGAAGPAPLRAAALDIEPYGKLGPDGQPSGIFVETYAMLGQELGRRIEVTVAPYARSVAMLRSNMVDLLIAIPNAAIAQVAVPQGMIWTVDVLVLGRAGQHLASQKDLAGLTVGRIRGTEYGANFLNDPRIRHFETANQLQGLRMLMEKRLDAVVGTRVAIFHAMRQLKLRREDLGTSLLAERREVHVHLANRLVGTPLAAQLRHAVETVRASERYAEMMVRYAADLPKE